MYNATIIGKDWTPPWCYEGTRLSPATRGAIALADLPGRVQLFSRDGLILVGSLLLWHGFDETPLKADEDRIVVYSAGRLIALGAAYGSTDSSAPVPTPTEALLLCWEIFCVYYVGEDREHVLESAFADLNAKIASLDETHPLRRVDANRLLALAKAQHTLSNVYENQLVFSRTLPSGGSSARSWCTSTFSDSMPRAPTPQSSRS